jgi:hypothetical protein
VLEIRIVTRWNPVNRALLRVVFLKG